MKKLFLGLMLCASAAVFAAAQEPVVSGNAPAAVDSVPAAAAAPAYEQYPVSYLQLGIWYKFPMSQMSSQVYGIKTGWPMCAGQGSVTGIEASWLGSLTHYIYGIQAGWTVCFSRELYGLQATLLTCLNTDKLQGIQASPVFNLAGDVMGLQASSVNVSGNFIGFQPAAILNVAKNFTGFQAAPVLNVAADVSGLQAGLINKAAAADCQLGLINVSKSGFQFGLLNFMENGFMPCFPIVNFGCE